MIPFQLACLFYKSVPTVYKCTSNSSFLNQWEACITALIKHELVKTNSYLQ